ncbi:DUF3017 domain-containing protein [Granulicoccus sp. GXG6511]|uniref:DUF3017 domain-containing protein n=1 Tax=Granulicoccus sp. GXG6511 TaxID=3381351 RepID=UPI003D7D7D04
MEPDNTGSFKAIARAKASSLTQWPLLLVLGLVAICLVLVVLGYWRRGTALMGAALCLAAGLRALLPRDVAGLLQVRGRAFDVTFLLGCGVGIIVLAMNVPAP